MSFIVKSVALCEPNPKTLRTSYIQAHRASGVPSPKPRTDASWSRLGLGPDAGCSPFGSVRPSVQSALRRVALKRRKTSGRSSLGRRELEDQQRDNDTANTMLRLMVSEGHTYNYNVGFMGPIKGSFALLYLIRAMFMKLTSEELSIFVIYAFQGTLSPKTKVQFSDQVHR